MCFCRRFEFCSDAEGTIEARTAEFAKGMVSGSASMMSRGGGSSRTARQHMYMKTMLSRKAMPKLVVALGERLGAPVNSRL